MHAALDNPFWSSLQTVHSHLALRQADAARFPAGHAPFLGIAAADADVADALHALVAPGESVYLLGVAPCTLPSTFELEFLGDLAQMVCEMPLANGDTIDIRPLHAADRTDVLALTVLVYPHYFRERTIEMGRYFGIHRDGRLAAMIGERLGTDDARELSAICTHPDFSGRGYARALTAMLANDTLARGRLPFLHVSHANTRARALYERMGFRLRRDIPFWSLQRKRSAS